MRKLVLIDMSLAFFGAILYCVLFNFLINSLSLPRAIVLVQLSANALYGFFGLFIFLSKKYQLFRALILMNFCYSVFCILVGLILPAVTLEGAILLLAEGAFIFYLALFERKNMQSV